MRNGLKLVAALALALLIWTTKPIAEWPRHPVLPPPTVADASMQVDLGRMPIAELQEHRRLDRALRALAAQRPGVVDAYVVSVALDSDPVFGREARAAGNVLRRRYDAEGRTIVLAGSDGRGSTALASGTPASLAVALARVAELMDEDEDALILYTTSHGAPYGLSYEDGDRAYGAISPARLRAMLASLGIGNRLLILSACYSGVFVPVLQSPTTAIVTASSRDRTSFGCAAENDWTFFGDALINNALRQPQPFRLAFDQARQTIEGWEKRFAITPSRPQISIGTRTEDWLAALERRMPRTGTRPVGRPSIETTFREYRTTRPPD